MVIIPHTPRVFRRTPMNSTISSLPKDDVKLWLVQNVGTEQFHLGSDTNEKKPWRHRVWTTGADSSHCFFFFNKRDAMLFKLAWS